MNFLNDKRDSEGIFNSLGIETEQMQRTWGDWFDGSSPTCTLRNTGHDPKADR